MARTTKKTEIATGPSDFKALPSIAVAVLGSGGREHALASKIAESPLCKKVVVVPGNAGMTPGPLKKLSIHPLGKPLETAADFAALAKDLKELEVEFVVVGPDNLLEMGVVDYLQSKGFDVFGPTREAAKIEWSKAYAKSVMAVAKVPTAKHIVLNKNKAEKINQVADDLGGFPIVLKYDGLALGKGVQLCNDEMEAKDFLSLVFDRQKFKRSEMTSEPVVVAEQFLTGHELSLFAVTDGTSFVPLEPACDYKRLLESDRGPNTGGMGAYSPVPWIARSKVTDIANAIFPPILEKMRASGTPFQGLLYAGLMVDRDQFSVLEFNARFGDPETQALLPRLESDLLPLLLAAAKEELEQHLDFFPVRWSDRTCVNIVAASAGYPEKPILGKKVSVDPQFEARATQVRIYFSGVDSEMKSSGGRVFSASALGEGLEEARTLALAAMKYVQFEGMQYRRDVGRVRPEF